MEHAPRGAAKLIEAMITYDPRKRITAAQALAAEYFDDIPEIIREIRRSGLNDEEHLKLMEAAWREVRGVPADAPAAPRSGKATPSQQQPSQSSSAKKHVKKKASAPLAPMVVSAVHEKPQAASPQKHSKYVSGSYYQPAQKMGSKIVSHGKPP